MGYIALAGVTAPTAVFGFHLPHSRWKAAVESRVLAEARMIAAHHRIQAAAPDFA